MPDLFFYRNPEAEEEPEDDVPEPAAPVADDWANQAGGALAEFPQDQEFPEDWADVADDFQATAGAQGAPAQNGMPGQPAMGQPGMPPQPQMGYPPQGQGMPTQGGYA